MSELYDAMWGQDIERRVDSIMSMYGLHQGTPNNAGHSLREHLIRQFKHIQRQHPPLSVNVGTVLYGVCGGVFGRDHMGPCRVEALGADWVVVRNLDDSVDPGTVDIATFETTEAMHSLLAQFSVKS